MHRHKYVTTIIKVVVNVMGGGERGKSQGEE